MKAKFKFMLVFFMLGATTYDVSSQTLEQSKKKAAFSVEIDPATFVFNGYSAHLRITPRSSNHMLYGLGIYAMDMPSLFVDMNNQNAGNDWNVRIDRGIGAFGEYHFTEVNRKVFVGMQLSSQDFRIENSDVSGNENFTNGLVMGYSGYTFQPFPFPLYFKAWGGIGYTSKIAGNNVIEGLEYDIAPVSVFATLHIGYTFNY